MIYIAKHKECETLEQDGYIPLNLWDLKIKDNLFKYNPYLNELTAHYHIWKHTDDDIKGVVQYRKYLIDDITNKPITIERTKDLLKQYDIITTEKYIVGNGIIDNLRYEIGDKKQLNLLNKYYDKLINRNPDLKEYFSQTYFNPGDMFICKREIFDSYCEWLFDLILPITIEFDKDVDKNCKIRLLCYLFERLLTYWLQKNNLKIKELKYNITQDRI